LAHRPRAAARYHATNTITPQPYRRRRSRIAVTISLRAFIISDFE